MRYARTVNDSLSVIRRGGRKFDKGLLFLRSTVLCCINKQPFNTEARGLVHSDQGSSNNQTAGTSLQRSPSKGREKLSFFQRVKKFVSFRGSKSKESRKSKSAKATGAKGENIDVTVGKKDTASTSSKGELVDVTVGEKDTASTSSKGELVDVTVGEKDTASTSSKGELVDVTVGEGDTASISFKSEKDDPTYATIADVVGSSTNTINCDPFYAQVADAIEPKNEPKNEPIYAKVLKPGRSNMKTKQRDCGYVNVDVSTASKTKNSEPIHRTAKSPVPMVHTKFLSPLSILRTTPVDPQAKLASRIEPVMSSVDKPPIFVVLKKAKMNWRVGPTSRSLHEPEIDNTSIEKDGSYTIKHRTIKPKRLDPSRYKPYLN